jgi:fructoselysine-6-P-deglycase FrlB-like protein
VGKPFAAELDSLPATFDWSMNHPLDDIVRAFRGLTSLPLLAIGSGGSFTVAHLASALHVHYTKRIAQAMTPLQLIASPADLRDLAVFIPTAGGKNPDVLGGFRHLVSEEPRSLMVWCATPESPLADAAAKYRFVDFLEFAPPCGKDGFLAVNSLLAFSILLARAYADALGVDAALPRSFHDLICDRSWTDAKAVDLRCAELWSRNTLVVLHGPSTLPAAVDIESKFTEAALGSVQVADYRHFAHGRHHWIAKRGQESAVLAIVCDDDRQISDAMLGLLPPDVPVVRIDVSHSGYLAAIAAMSRGFFVTASAGRARGFDPGDPGVPSFGREIYHLNVYRSLPPEESGVPPGERLAIERKARTKVAELSRSGRLDSWREAYSLACSTLFDSAYCGLALDYDGTLCHEGERYGPLPQAMADEFERLLKAGGYIGIATGRGKSVRRSLQEALPKDLWDRVLIGYYNGAEVGLLGNDKCPDDREEVGPELQQVADGLRSDPFITRLASFSLRLKQITLTPADGVFPGPLWEYVHALLLSSSYTGAVALRSGHSVDIVTPETTKLTAVERVAEMAGNGRPVLRIGDRGRWPGNDFALLDSAHSLSADEVSPDPKGAWNLAPTGHRGSQATLGYLRRLKSTRKGLRLAPITTKRGGR